MAIYVAAGVLFGIIVAFTTWLEYRLASRRTPWYAYITVWLGWIVGFSILYLVPIDLWVTERRGCLEEDGSSEEEDCLTPVRSLEVLWRFLYWTALAYSWLVVPFLQEYVWAGEFTVYGRCKRSLKENALFYGACGVPAVVALVIVAIRKRLNARGVRGLVIACANAWGLILLVGLLGFALVEIPRKLWHKANVLLSLRHCEFRAVTREIHLDDTRAEVDDTVKLVREVHRLIPSDHPLRPYVDVIIRECPLKDREEMAQAGSGTTATIARASRLGRRVVDAEKELDDAVRTVQDTWSLKKLAKLHKDIRNSMDAYQRAQCQWDELLSEAFDLEDILDNGVPDKEDWCFVSSVRPLRTGTWGAILERFEYVWKVRLRSIVYRLTAICLAVLSATILWSEVTIYWVKQDKDIGVWSRILLAVPSPSEMEYLVLVGIPLSYMCVCSFSSLFGLRIFNYYQIHGNKHTDPGSLLFSSMYVARVAAPLSFNFMNLIKASTNTVFSRIMGDMDVLPFFGADFNIYFPLFVLVLCLITFFNLYSRILRSMGLNRFVFEEDFSDDQMHSGRELLLRERESRERAAAQAREQPTAVNITERRRVRLEEGGGSQVTKARWLTARERRERQEEEEEEGVVELVP